LDVLVEYAQGYTQTFAFYQAIPQQPSFRGGVSLFTVTTDVAGVSVTEPGALSLCMMGLGALAVYGTRHLRD
ncbi:MAG TPA: PEP-CTERM sorting domain-containing protein, partial [Bryobacteraceae bacterium]|nr:PEP-CTERM sorting domain-containing protein [Bryobacteraceae bacterium]